MVRSIVAITVTVSFLFCSSHVYSDSPLVFPVMEEELVAGCTCVTHSHSSSVGHTRQPCPVKTCPVKSCPILGHRNLFGRSAMSMGYGMARLSEHGVTHRLGAGGPCPQKAGRVQGQMMVHIQDLTGITTALVMPLQPGAMPGQLVSVPGQIVGVMLPSRQMKVHIQDSTGATPGYTLVMPLQPGATPGQLVSVPGQIVGITPSGQMPQDTPRQPVSVPGQIVGGMPPGQMMVHIQDPMGITPGYMAAMPVQPGAMPGQLVSVPGQIVGIMPPSQMTVHIQDPTGITPGYTLTMPLQPGATPGQTVIVPGQIVGTVPGQVDAVPGQVAMHPGQMAQISVEPPPGGGFFGSVFSPRPYQPAQQPVGVYGYPTPPQERIVYVPYAMPPPITVERLGKALPMPMMPLPQMVRRVLGDTSMYEYPEMPLHLYTTRGPRDFFVPMPPSIGE